MIRAEPASLRHHRERATDQPNPGRRPPTRPSSSVGRARSPSGSGWYSSPVPSMPWRRQPTMSVS